MPQVVFPFRKNYGHPLQGFDATRIFAARKKN